MICCCWQHASANPNDLLQKEFISMVEQAKDLYSKGEKEKKNEDMRIQGMKIH